MQSDFWKSYAQSNVQLISGLRPYPATAAHAMDRVTIIIWAAIPAAIFAPHFLLRLASHRSAAVVAARRTTLPDDTRPLPVTPRNGKFRLTNGNVIPFDPDQRTASNEVNDQPMARIDWTYALSLAATLAIAAGAMSILLFGM
ncbi:hypothetical protein CQ14_30920 [Bradyrhizobium lablabi]|uniref:Uncharacterized protein n=1 Tax=Bradyrhizobium lablabi TaxID=722472 RepID=A0A0R3MSP2_9BRAD|nr:hypothetical protein CQ14_30920 [Bradyrhizobium lablabi]